MQVDKANPKNILEDGSTMNRFYIQGFEDLRAEYLPKLESACQSLGIFNLLLLLELKYKKLYNQSLVPELILQPGLTVVSTPSWFERMLYSVGFAGVLEWLADMISVGTVKDLTRDSAALSLLEAQLRAKSYSLLLQGLGQIK